MRNEGVVKMMLDVLEKERKDFEKEFDMCDTFKELARVCFLKHKLTELDAKIDTLKWVLGIEENI